MRVLNTVSRVSELRLRLLFAALVAAFTMALVLEIKATHSPWWKHAKDVLLIIVALATAYNQLIADSMVSFIDASEPEGTPDEAENTYRLYIRVQHPTSASIGISSCNAELCSARSLLEVQSDQELTITCDARMTHESIIQLDLRLPFAPPGEYSLAGSIDLKLDVYFAPGNTQKVSTRFQYPVSGVVSVGELA